LAFYKAVLQGFGPALSATVVRDRLIGVFFGLIVFGTVEQVLWPVRARDALRARLAEILHLLAELGRAGTRSATPSVTHTTVDSWRPRISLKVEEVQGLIESSKFELGDINPSEIQKLTGDIQIIFILLLSLARQGRDIAQSNVVRTSAVELDSVIATALEALATRVGSGSESPVPGLEDTLNTFARSMTGTDALDKEAVAHFAGRLALYCTLVAAIKRLSSESLNTGQDGHWSLSANGERFFERRESRTN
jgi:hypothetical protein